MSLVSFHLARFGTEVWLQYRKTRTLVVQKNKQNTAHIYKVNDSQSLM